MLAAIASKISTNKPKKGLVLIKIARATAFLGLFALVFYFFKKNI
jgi:hypothetical protein